MSGITIGKLAKEAGTGIETIRFYERQGLIAAPPRTASNYRIYPAEEVDRLRFIKRAKMLGFTLNEIKDLLALSHDSRATRADIKDRTIAKIAKIADVNRKIDDLVRIRHALLRLTAECDGHGPLDGCPILKALSGDNKPKTNGGAEFPLPECLQTRWLSYRLRYSGLPMSLAAAMTSKSR